jgi:hypothetical protein
MSNHDSRKGSIEATTEAAAYCLEMRLNLIAESDPSFHELGKDQLDKLARLLAAARKEAHDGGR